MDNLDKTEVLCLNCATIFKTKRPTEREIRINPKGLGYCPICNETTNHISLKSFNNLLEVLGITNEQKEAKPQEKGHEFIKK